MYTVENVNNHIINLINKYPIVFSHYILQLFHNTVKNKINKKRNHTKKQKKLLAKVHSYY